MDVYETVLLKFVPVKQNEPSRLEENIFVEVSVI
jgi:hypothetical protein